MHRLKIVASFLVYSLAAALAGLLSLSAYVLYRSLPQFEARIEVQGLQTNMEIQHDRLGVPAINAGNRNDAYFGLGFMLAHDRLFQMDLMRRSGNGRLAELFGAKALGEDERHRLLGFEQVATQIVSRLANDERAALQAYCNGVNAGMRHRTALPVEFTLLGYRPEPWRPEDSVLVILKMYEMLSNSADDEHMLSVMAATLPAEVTAFFTPRIDRYTARLLFGHNNSPAVVPEQALQQVLTSSGARGQVALTALPPGESGSNAWVVAPSRTQAGHPLLANDPHLKLGLPNIWYRAELHYADKHLTGATLPGVPAMVSGSNGQVAWGYTNVQGDFLDLVTLEEAPDHPDAYRVAEGWEPFGHRQEIIKVRNAPDRSLSVRTTRWGPVLPERLLGRSIAMHWLALDPAATTLGMLALDGVPDVPAARTLFQHIGGPPQNVMLADTSGTIGWTLMGNIPKRFGMDGATAQYWGDGKRGWAGYVAATDIPSLINPPSGFIVTANQRTVALDHPYILGHNFSSGYRAFRITQVLSHDNPITPESMAALQRDTRTDFYDYYKRLALRVLSHTKDTEALAIRTALEQWDGHANATSLGLPLLVEFRTRLTDAVFSPFLATCRAADPQFIYRWRTSDEPLRALLRLASPALLPEPDRYQDWDNLVRTVLLESARTLSAKYAPADIRHLTWGQVNQVKVGHPFSRLLPVLSILLDMPEEPLPGCALCVRVATEDNKGASERLVVAPGQEHAGLFTMPGGQSEHPLSPHYRDQQMAWLTGPAGHLVNTKVASFKLLPADTTLRAP